MPVAVVDLCLRLGSNVYGSVKIRFPHVQFDHHLPSRFDAGDVITNLEGIFGTKPLQPVSEHGYPSLESVERIKQPNWRNRHKEKTLESGRQCIKLTPSLVERRDKKKSHKLPTVAHEPLL